eukprot:3420872-Alexandrium_andersonii.AAC.1
MGSELSHNTPWGAWGDATKGVSTNCFPRGGLKFAQCRAIRVMFAHWQRHFQANSSDFDLDALEDTPDEQIRASLASYQEA